MDLLCTENIRKDIDTDIYQQHLISSSPQPDCDSSSYSSSPINKRSCDSLSSNSNNSTTQLINSYNCGGITSYPSNNNNNSKEKYYNDLNDKDIKDHEKVLFQNQMIYTSNIINRSLDFVNTANSDPTFLNERCLENALKAEERRPHPACTYFKTIQTDITPPMRKIVTEWMMELCAEEKSQAEVVFLAISYMDRFLLTTSVRKTQLQILASACLLLASKLREPSCRALSADLLVFYTDNSIYKSDLIQWELYVLSRLGWDLSTVTPLDFLELLLIRLPIKTENYPDITVEKVRQHAKAFISLAAKEHYFSVYPSSTIAASSIAASLSGLSWHLRSGFNIRYLLNLLTDLTSVDQEFLQDCMMKMIHLFNEHSRNLEPYLAHIESNQNSHNNHHHKYQTYQSKPQQYNNKEPAPTENNSIDSHNCSQTESVDISPNLKTTNGSNEYIHQGCKMQSNAKPNIQDIKY